MGRSSEPWLPCADLEKYVFRVPKLSECVSTKDDIGYNFNLLIIGDAERAWRIIGVVSLILFWAMIQMGVAVTVACLPTLRPLFHGFSPEAIVHSTRSKMSLASLRSKGSGSSNEIDAERGTTSSESVAAFISEGPAIEHGNGQSARDANIHTFAMDPIWKERGEVEVSPNGIHVNKGISRSVEEV